MNQDPTVWPRKPWFRIAGFALSLGFLYGAVRLWRDNTQDLVQRENIVSYARTYLPSIPGWRFTIITDQTGSLAVPGDKELYRTKIRANKPVLRKFLQENVYEGQPVWIVLKWPLLSFVAVFLAFARLGRTLDAKFSREARDGRLLRGPELMSQTKFNLQNIKPWEFWKRKKSFFING